LQDVPKAARLSRAPFMAFLDPSVLLVFFGALALAYGAGRLVRALRGRWQQAHPPAPVPMTRAERRRAMRERR
jgi:hypothetical protein